MTPWLSAIFLVGLVVLAPGCDSEDSGGQVPEGPVELEAVRRFDEFPLYWLGTSFDGLRLSAAERPRAQLANTAAGQPGRISFIYGTCEAPRDAGCMPPLSVITEPGAEPERYGRRDVSTERVRALGVPARIIGGRELELYTGRQIVVIAGDSRRRIRRAVRALRRANSPGDPPKRLPAPRFETRPIR